MKTGIIARHEENLDWTESLPSDIHLFVVRKGEHVPNVGRESYSYLWYILENYDSLEGFYYFLQGNPNNHLLAGQLDSALLSPTSPRFFGIIHECHNDGSPHHPGLPLEAFVKDTGMNTTFPLTFNAGSQFVVNAQTIRRHPHSFYANLFNLHHKYDLAPWIIERLWHEIFTN
jgi:hypothetical protein